MAVCVFALRHGSSGCNMDAVLPLDLLSLGRRSPTGLELVIKSPFSCARRAPEARQEQVRASVAGPVTMVSKPRASAKEAARGINTKGAACGAVYTLCGLSLITTSRSRATSDYAAAFATTCSRRGIPLRRAARVGSGRAQAHACGA